MVLIWFVTEQVYGKRCNTDTSILSTQPFRCPVATHLSLGAPASRDTFLLARVVMDLQVAAVAGTRRAALLVLGAAARYLALRVAVCSSKQGHRLQLLEMNRS